jgi:hypothetical protein
MNNLLRSSKLFLNRNSSTILTCVGGVGVVVTAVLTAKATPKALKLVEEAKEEKEDLSKFEIVRTAAPAYIPAVIAGAATIACIFGANILNKRQQAAIMSAYALLDSSYKDYRDKVQELYGEDADTKVKEGVAKDKYEDNGVSTTPGKHLFYDEFSKRYFESTISDVLRAEYHINRDLSMRDYATVNEFYEYLGLDPIPSGDALGWSTGMNFDYYWQSWIDFGHSKMTMEDGRECYMITVFEEPILGWEEY